MISNIVTFLTSNVYFKNVRDIVYDEMGAWKHNASPLKRFDVPKSTRSLKIIPSNAVFNPLFDSAFPYFFLNHMLYHNETLYEDSIIF